MSDSGSMWLPEDGALSLENWQAAAMGAPARDAFEFPLFSDATLEGEITAGFGPYMLLNGLTSPVAQDPRLPAAFLRVENHLDYHFREFNETYDVRYHGGFIQDELAALLSLTLGIRLKAGGPTRHFQKNGDPRGRPWGIKMPGQEDPLFISATAGPILPRCTGQHSVVLHPHLGRFAELNQAASVAVVRAARMYQHAVWVAESDPSQAWLFLVSAIETAAVQWKQDADSPVDRLTTWKPELAELLVVEGGESLVEAVALIVAPYVGSTKRFIDFCIHFLPDPPSQRPVDWAQHRWSKTALRKSLSKIYDHRSRALHAGVPFPAPMGWAPRIHGDGYDEKPAAGGTGAGVGDHTWVSDDIPMLLHVFEYFAREALLAWWAGLYGVPGAVSHDAEGGDRSVTEGSVESFPASDAPTY